MKIIKYFATFNVKSFWDADMLSLQCGESYKDDVDIIALWLASPEYREYILQPANIMRPDGLHIGLIDGHHPSRYWTLLLSAKFHSDPMSGQDTINQDKNSTDWRLAYYTKKLETTFCNMVDKLEGVRKYYVHCGSLRIHFILPGLASSNDGLDRGGCRVEGDDVIMYIDKTMLGKLFSSLSVL